MDYAIHYNRLIEKAKGRILEGYVERHHIVPRCIGGSDSKKNLVALTPEEHFVAHQLLCKIYPNHSKLVYAANMMGNRTNKKYGWLRRKYAKRLSKDRKGNFKHTLKSKEKMSKARKGKAKSLDWRKAISKSKTTKVEYKGRIYDGYKELQNKTGVSRHLYLKHYINGRDPEPFICNRTYGMIEKSKTCKPKGCLGMKWYTNGLEERLSKKPIEGWKKGRACKI